MAERASSQCPSGILPTVNRGSAADDKIAFFRSLFRGREDVYPRRFESRTTGRAGYAPACANEWVRSVCGKPKIRCADCRNRRLLPVTDEAVRWHLTGADAQGKPFVMGVYPMLLDETCSFLAADFDQEGWREDCSAFLETCRLLGIPAALERSRSGNGGHVWLFFAEFIPAALARRFGASLLTETAERRPEIGFASYDRFFPNQDTLPQGGFGNLIALPLQHVAREAGNSVFLDEQFAPFADQWQFLSSLRRLPRTEVEARVRGAERKGGVTGVRLALSDEAGDVAPWGLPPSRLRTDPVSGDLPASLELVLGDLVYVPKAGLSPSLRNRLLRLAAFQNPEFCQAQAMRLPVHGKPRIIACAEDSPNYIGLPRGCLDELKALLSGLGVRWSILDERYGGTPLEVVFHGTLRKEQKAAAEALRRHSTGVLAATTAFGKTVIAAYLIARRAVNTLILVHLRQLQEQWVERLSHFFDLPTKEIGRIGGGKRRVTGQIDVALIQSLVRKGVVNDLVANYGQVIVDECHHVSAANFEQVLRRVKARYVAGLSATVMRKDGHHPVIFMQCGPVRHRVDAKAQAGLRPFRHTVQVHPTAFSPPAPPAGEEEADARMRFHDLSVALATNAARNERIAADVAAAVRCGRSPVVLTERTAHLACLEELLKEKLAGVPVFVLRGGLGRKELRAIQEQLAAVPDDQARVLLATGRFLGEGFDDPRLDTLFLAFPVSWRGTVTQYAGRLHRLHDGKREVVIHDYADLESPLLARMFERRCKGYEAIGYTITLPASAVPGWPQDVPLPSDPEWKRDYAASIRRLVKDGVDVPLADLFVHAARSFPEETEGAARARSASEAFLYRRLQTLEETRGRFRLNAKLPLPLDGQGQMEVDLLCESHRVAIEIDGPQHFADLAAYRRDRRKDLLLQEDGWLVLRFLAEDVGKYLDDVLDTILRALARRRSF